MKIIFSPSKGMKYRELNNLKTEKQPFFLEKTEVLVNAIQNISKEKLGETMKIKGSLLDETFIRYKTFWNLPEYKAIELYNGVSFSNLEPEKYSPESITYLLKYLIIFSALYGALSPDTLIHPYRLDMTIKIDNFQLYNYWKSSIEGLFTKEEIILNLASSEFSKILDRKIYHVIDIEFRQNYDGKLKNISTEAKKMRGQLLNYLIQHQITDLTILKTFSQNGYSLCNELSEENKIFFIKNQ